LTAKGEPSVDSTLRAVLNTSVLLSEHRHWLWLLARLGYYEAVWSTFIVGELVRIRVEHSIKHGVERTVDRQRINDLIHLLSDVLGVGNYRSASAAGLLSDPDDEPILATALAAGAVYIVSLNTRDFPATGKAAGVQFVTPQAFLMELASLHPTDDLTERADEAGRQLP
jgi:predicted nucleic acid-binding protein